MPKKSTAIYVKTESGDDYLWSISTKLTEVEVDLFLRDSLGEEYEFIGNRIVAYG